MVYLGELPWGGLEEEKRHMDPIEDVANTIRIVVHAEQAYDILDELASNPSNYSGPLYKLSRLAVKVLNDLERRRNEFKERYGERDYNNIRDNLMYLSLKLNKLLEYLSSMNDDGRREEEVKRLAALAIAPDKYSMEVKEALRG